MHKRAEIRAEKSSQMQEEKERLAGIPKNREGGARRPFIWAQIPCSLIIMEIRLKTVIISVIGKREGHKTGLSGVFRD